MNHRRTHRKLNRTSSHRAALHRNLAQSLFEHGQIQTTLPKAKDLRPFAEKLITLAKKAKSGSLIARRRLHKMMGDRLLIPAEHREAYEGLSDAKRKTVLRSRSGRRYRAGAATGSAGFTAESVTHRLIETIAPQFTDRPGGYTRLIRLAGRRVGDQTPLAIVQLVGDEEAPTGVARPRKNARKVRSDARYGAAARAAKSVAANAPAKPESEADAQAAESEESEST